MAHLSSGTQRSPSTQTAVEVLFSDLDGTLVHYPKDFGAYARIVNEDEAAGTAVVEYATNQRCECVVMSSMTGGKAYMSCRTVDLVKRLRSLGVTFVIITGARTSTYEQRRAVLPDADFEFFENGGRMLCDGVLDASWTDTFVDEVGPVQDRVHPIPTAHPLPEDRKGTLWTLYNQLKADGWYVDARDYTTNFRVDVNKSSGKSAEDWLAVVRDFVLPAKLASSFNLGKADVYPATSGKANAAAHILKLKEISAESAVAMFDDDNDLELGALVGRSFLPGVTHPSVLKAMELNAGRWTLTDSKGFLGTEEALERILALREEHMPLTGSVDAPVASSVT